MKKILVALLAFSTSLCTMAQSKANYNVVPLPKSIDYADSTQSYTLRDGFTIAYPTGNVEVAHNANFLKTYIKEQTGLESLVEDATSKEGKKAAIMLQLRSAKQQTANSEAYTITVGKKGIVVTANTDEGIFRAIQTLRKSLPLPSASAKKDKTEAADSKNISFPFVTINDEPRFGYRGQHLDVARHYFDADFIKRFIDILALHGVNQFHWHITDDQGWRFEVKSMPELAKRACMRSKTVLGHNCYSKNEYLYDNTEYGRDCYYTQQQMREIVRYAADRYINIIPEIDLPGHMVAALSVYPELGCTGGPYEPWPLWGVSDDVLCAGNPKTLEFLKTVLGELCDVFPSKYIHIGGDESPRVRWQHCPKCQAKMKALGLKKEAELQTYINKELDKFLTEKGRTLIGWDETLEGGLSENAVVMSWRGYEGGIEAARQHHPVIMTPTGNCYIDYYQLKGETNTQPLAIGGYLPVSKVYSMEPVPDKLTAEEQQYIWGPQCNLWTEYVLSSDHVEFMLLPRLAAMSEVQWLNPDQKNFKAFEQRLKRLQKLYDLNGYKYCGKYE